MAGHPRWVATYPEPASRACDRKQTHVIHTEVAVTQVFPALATRRPVSRPTSSRFDRPRIPA